MSSILWSVHFDITTPTSHSINVRSILSFVRFDLARSNAYVVSGMILHDATRSMYWITPFYPQSVYDAAAAACVRKDENRFFNDVARLATKP
jgi:hypothetical protein